MTIKDLVPKWGRGRDQALARREESDPFRSLQRQMNRLFDEFFSDFPLAPRWGGADLAPAGFAPRVDVSETDKEVRISAELPGMDEKDIAVEMDETAVTIRGERSEEKEDKGKNWSMREQSFGAFHRIVPLPARVESGKTSATFKKGVLTITAPKKAEEQARRKTIRIETD